MLGCLCMEELEDVRLSLHLDYEGGAVQKSPRSANGLTPRLLGGNRKELTCLPERCRALKSGEQRWLSEFRIGIDHSALSTASRSPPRWILIQYLLFTALGRLPHCQGQADVSPI